MNQFRKLAQSSGVTQLIASSSYISPTKVSPEPTRLIIKYLMFTSSYGFYRNITSDPKPDELLINKFNNSLINGVLYANPITLPIVITRLLERIEIKLTKTDPQKHRESYRELYNYNYNTI
jgi:hypothetical protein